MQTGNFEFKRRSHSSRAYPTSALDALYLPLPQILIATSATHIATNWERYSLFGYDIRSGLVYGRKIRSQNSKSRQLSAEDYSIEDEGGNEGGGGRALSIGDVRP